MAAKKRAASAPSNRYVTAGDPDDLGPADRLAHDILTVRGDLLPSVDRIMSAGLDDTGAAEALSLFQAALDAPGDPNRDPRIAIAAAGGAPA